MMTAQEILKKPNAVERASEGGFYQVALWRWRTGKCNPSIMNAAKLAKVLGYEFGLKNGKFDFWKRGK